MNLGPKPGTTQSKIQGPLPEPRGLIPGVAIVVVGPRALHANPTFAGFALGFGFGAFAEIAGGRRHESTITVFEVGVTIFMSTWLIEISFETT